MKVLVAWILMSAVTYWFTKHSRFGKNVFQHNLKVEGTKRDVIALFCIGFAVAWPLWWLLMFPICSSLHRAEEPPRTDHARNGENRRDIEKEVTMETSTNAKEMRDAFTMRLGRRRKNGYRL